MLGSSQKTTLIIPIMTAAYLIKLIGIRSLRILFRLAIFALSPKQSTPAPKPRRTVYVRQSDTRNVRCDIYLPSAADANALAPSKKTLPVVVNLHGSGFTLSGIGDDARFCQLLADSIPCAVVDVDYSKGPERPFPEANEDIDTVLEWLRRGDGAKKDARQVAHELAFTPYAVNGTRIALTGFSAGGNLALTTCVRARKRDRLNDVCAVAAFYPSTNLSESPYKKPQVKPAKDASGGVLPPIIRSFFYSCYLPNTNRSKQDPTLPTKTSPLISPLYADASSFPHSVTIITCGRDSLAREGRQFAEHVVAGRTSAEQRAEYAHADAQANIRKIEPPSDVPDVDRIAVAHDKERQGVVWWEAPGQGHAWDKMVKPGSEPEQLREQSYALAVRRLREALLTS